VNRKERMKLLDALKHFSIRDLEVDEDRYLFKGDDSDTETYEFFIQRLKEQVYDEDTWTKLCDLEVTEEFLNALKDGEMDEYPGDFDNQSLLNAAWLTFKEIDDTSTCDEDFLYVDDCNYEFCFSDFDFAYEYECDIDLT
jgi:hypothetical protein